jgi:hypothetical protein
MEVDRQNKPQLVNDEGPSRKTGAKYRAFRGRTTASGLAYPIFDKQDNDGTEELHKALRASKEIAETWTLYSFLYEVRKMGATLPDFETVDTDAGFKKFLKGVIVCAEAAYDPAALQAAAVQGSRRTDYL